MGSTFNQLLQALDEERQSLGLPAIFNGELHEFVFVLDLDPANPFHDSHERTAAQAVFLGRLHLLAQLHHERRADLDHYHVDQEVFRVQWSSQQLRRLEEKFALHHERANNLETLATEEFLSTVAFHSSLSNTLLMLGQAERLALDALFEPLARSAFDAFDATHRGVSPEHVSEEDFASELSAIAVATLYRRDVRKRSLWEHEKNSAQKKLAASVFRLGLERVRELLPVMSPLQDPHWLDALQQFARAAHELPDAPLTEWKSFLASVATDGAVPYLTPLPALAALAQLGEHDDTLVRNTLAATVPTEREEYGQPGGFYPLYQMLDRTTVQPELKPLIHAVAKRLGTLSETAFDELITQMTPLPRTCEKLRQWLPELSGLPSEDVRRWEVLLLRGQEAMRPNPALMLSPMAITPPSFPPPAIFPIKK